MYAHSRITPTCLTSCWGLLLNGTGTSAPDFRRNVADLPFVRCGYINDFSKCIFLEAVGFQTPRGVCHRNSWRTARLAMAVYIPMVMLGYFQPDGPKQSASFASSMSTVTAHTAIYISFPPPSRSTSLLHTFPEPTSACHPGCQTYTTATDPIPDQKDYGDLEHA